MLTEYQRTWVQAREEGKHAIRDRIFIADEIERMKLADKWNDLTKTFDENRDIDLFENNYESIAQALRTAATKSMR